MSAARFPGFVIVPAAADAWRGGRSTSFRVAEEKLVEHWAVRDDLKVIEAIDAPAG
jgi:predicted SnoaL-like aldol condensation-catalyzing enzyme